jgi:D-lactate dehydrogenase (cytochrome)
VPVARIEFSTRMLRGVNVYSNTSYAETPTPFYEFHGSEASVAEQAGAPAGGTRARPRGFQWRRGRDRRNCGPRG